MRILIAEDDSISRRILETRSALWGYEVVSVEDGAAAWKILGSRNAPRLVALDWMMPGIDGVEICRRLRFRKDSAYVYVILLTAKDGIGDTLTGLEAGADDYLIKPYDPQELRWRLQTGKRVLELESTLEKKVEELRGTMAHIRQLQGLLPICPNCKKIRDDRNTWHRLETYVQAHADVRFSHSLCRECLARHYPEEAADPDATL